MDIQVQMKEEREQKNGRMEYRLKFILLLLAYSINSTQFTSIPILFYRSQLQCVNDKGASYLCSVQDACSNPNGYSKHSEYPQLHTLTMFLDLFCDREVLEAWILTISNFGRISANIILILFPLRSETKERWIGISTLVSGLALCSLNFFSSLEMFVVVYFLWYHSSSYLYGLVFSHLVESFPESIQKFGSAYLNNSTPIMMLLYIVFAYFFGSWENTLIHFTGVPLLLVGIVSLILAFKLYPPHITSTTNITSASSPSLKYQVFQNSMSNGSQPKSINLDYLTNSNTSQITQVSSIQCKGNSEVIKISENIQPTQSLTSSQDNIDFFELAISQNEEQRLNQKNSLQNGIMKKYFPFLNKDRNLRKNFYLWTLGFVCYVVNYYGVCLILNTLKGNLFFNCLVSTAFELLSSIISTTLIVKYNNQLKNIIRITQLITGIAFLSTLFIGDPTNSLNQMQSDEETLNSSQIFYLLFSLSPIIIAKITFEITPSVLMAYQKDVIPVKYQQSQLSCSNLLTMVISNIIPFYKYFSSSLSVNPFIGLGIITIATAYYSKYFVVISNDIDKKKSDETD